MKTKEVITLDPINFEAFYINFDLDGGFYIPSEERGEIEIEWVNENTGEMTSISLK